MRFPIDGERGRQGDGENDCIVSFLPISPSPCLPIHFGTDPDWGQKQPGQKKEPSTQPGAVARRMTKPGCLDRAVLSCWLAGVAAKRLR